MRNTPGLRTATAGAVLAVGVLAAACSSQAGAAATAPSPAGIPLDAYQSPMRATLSWFAAINRKDAAAAVAHFAPADTGQMDWLNGVTSTWPTFSRLRCHPSGATGGTASVTCTFHESQAPAAGSPDNFWTVYLTRQADGRWLITNYGTG